MVLQLLQVKKYPNGWILHASMKASETFYPQLATDNLPITRLTSSENSLQRLIGSIMLDDGTFIGAVDNDLTERNDITLPEGRTQAIERNSTGIYKGSIIDIDDVNKFNIIYEAKDVAYYFKEKGGALLFIGQKVKLPLALIKAIHGKLKIYMLHLLISVEKAKKL